LFFVLATHSDLVSLLAGSGKNSVACYSALPIKSSWSYKMILISQQVHCPNCGQLAERHHLQDKHLVRTQCAACDYLMITCSKTGRVIEAYAPGLFANAVR
jgi:MinD superfamily P-loop ATPase